MNSVTLAEIRAWPATVGVEQAARALGVSRSHAYDLITRGEFPVRVVQVGHRYRVVTADLVQLLSARQETPQEVRQVGPGSGAAPAAAPGSL